MTTHRDRAFAVVWHGRSVTSTASDSSVGPTADPRTAAHATALDGAWNFRDLGGTVTPLGTVRPGILLRAAVLSGLTPAGEQALLDLGVTDVFDLRGPREIEREGADRLPDGVTGHVAPFHPEQDDAPVHEAAEQQEQDPLVRARGYYERIPTLAPASESVATILRTLADGDGAVLVHCAAGKDRTGWTVATVLAALGADRETILSDYLLSNTAVGSLRDWMRDQYGAEQAAKPSDELLGVNQGFLDAAWRAMEQAHGDVDGYLRAIGLEGGLDGPVVARLRVRMLDA